MIVGVPKEIKDDEYRVAMTPSGAETLVRHGHTVVVETNAGVGSGNPDEEYSKVGANIAATREEVFAKAEMIVKVKEPRPSEYPHIRPGQLVFTYFHFAADEELMHAMVRTNAVCIAYETVELPDGRLPLLTPMSEVAGRVAVQEGAKYLERPMGGRGVLLSGVPGVPPAVVAILGGGVVGTNAAKVAAGMGARVYILDINTERLRYLDDVMPKNVTTLYSSGHAVRQVIQEADLVIGAVLRIGARAPALITRDMLKLMKPGAVIVDVAVDQGGCAETTRPTTHHDPVFVEEGVVHYCVANMPGAVALTSTYALTNETLPYVVRLAEMGYKDALQSDPALRKGLNALGGKVTLKAIADQFGYPYHSPESAIGL